MDVSDLSLREWDALPARRRTALAKAVVPRLPGPVRFVRVERLALAGTRHAIALFDVGGAAFALIPGGKAKLGFSARSFRPTPGQRESWGEWAEEYGYEGGLRQFLADTTTPVRTRTFAPFLLEVRPREVGPEPVPLDHPDVRGVVRDLKKRRGLKMIEVNNQVRVVRGARGGVTAYRIVRQTHEELVKSLARDGFRLPTSDEWEYACGAGTRTLFRWGDDCPCDRYPTDASWDLHLRPNAFGLQIAQNPYHWEVVAEKGTCRGGDGGNAMCGGAGFFLGWLPLATSYLDPNAEFLTEEGVGAFARRVLPLS
jgi:hypothetical protein